jgi:hypothetical protein
MNMNTQIAKNSKGFISDLTSNGNPGMGMVMKGLVTGDTEDLGPEHSLDFCKGTHPDHVHIDCFGARYMTIDVQTLKDNAMMGSVPEWHWTEEKDEWGEVIAEINWQQDEFIAKRISALINLCY